MKRIHSKTAAAFIAAPLTLAVAGLLLAASPASRSAMSTSSPPVLSPETLNVANSLSSAFRDVSKHVLPAVVAIENRLDSSWQADDSTSSETQEPQNPFKGTPFERMFPDGFPMNPGQGHMRPSPRQQVGIGSGVIIDPTGVVLTNNHVVEGNGKVIVKTQDGREFVATEVLTDPQTDIAIVKFSGDANLVAATLGDSDAMEVGDWVVALGQPFGLESTVTAGIVSAKDRGVGIAARENFIQTDAAINPGNSGGPLVNLKGEVIGINTAISTRSGGSDGVGFAVPSNLARWVSDQLLASGHVNRSYLGVSIQPVSYELSTQLGVAPHGGVTVTNVFPDTPAARSGLQAGDVIVKFDGAAVTTPQQLQLAVERATTGKTLVMDIVREGKPLELKYQPEMAPADFGARMGSATTPQGMQLNSLGLEIGTLSQDVAKQLGIGDVQGVLVTRVQEGSPAEMAGIEPGMVIAQVNRHDVSTVGEFEKLVKEDTDGSLLLLVRNQHGSRFVVVTK
ncbi:MAG: Do family serine endopeptidase [Planctomycetales bacterium]|nr:Do family serine endopeptidase [Planctomycetales bacterium]